MARRGPAWFGMAGMARLGGAGPGVVWYGRRGSARLGAAGLGAAGQGRRGTVVKGRLFRDDEQTESFWDVIDPIAAGLRSADPGVG